jgi:DNA-binding CsgD family transcriptional regulator
MRAPPLLAQPDGVMSWPLVGREEEVTFCVTLLRDGGAPGAVFAGAAGVGKTRLLREALAAAERHGRVTVRATATESAQAIPLGALSHLLPPESSRTATTLDLLRHARAAFAERSDHGPVVLGVDDAHLLDPASATLVLQLVSNRAAFVFASVRTGEPVPDAVSALWKDEGCASIELQPLSRSDARSLLEAALGGSVDGRTEHALWEAGRGTPLLLRELVLEGLQRECLTEREGLWSWHGELGRSRRLRELVSARIGALDAAQRDALELVALGEPLALSWLDDPATVDALVQRHVLDVVRDGRRVEARFAHPLHGEVVRAQMPESRAVVVRARLADAMEATGTRRRGDLLRLAAWRLESGGSLSAERLLAAARSSELAFAPQLAERFARAAEASNGGFAARHAVARAVAAQGRLSEAEQALARLEADAANDDERAMAAESRARLLAGGLARADDAAAVVAAARAAVGSPTWQSKLTLTDAWIRWRHGWPDDAAEVVLPVIADSTLDNEVRLSAVIFRAHMLGHLALTDDALALTESWLSVAERLDDQATGLADEAAFVNVVSLLLGGRLREAEAGAADVYRRALEKGDLERLGRAVWIQGCVAINRGDMNAALTQFRESVGVMHEVDARGMLPWALAMVAQAAGQAGDAEAAATATAAASAEAERSPESWIYSPSIVTARSWTSAAEGALAEARAFSLEAAEICERRGQRAGAVLGYHDVARFGRADIAAPRLARLAERAQGPLVRACAAHAAALAGGEANALLDVAEEFEAIGSPLFAAEALAEASAAYRAEGRSSSAQASAARARALLEHCPGARTPPLLHLRDSDELTAREREIATLAGHGLSNKEIAARLVVSVRTVENQLQRSYRKLGVTNRRDLASVLGPQVE